ncbi:hypothetical protein NPIL_184741 [Nephila pilipes]|uniref:Uncharacterized protein n=1 Tax=Nephila pilipes TaxID=299642 RepID=A0A8X6TWZ1_NEPPI|nr:hypothetical protein NPIL_184741 [Nephila pilipes]
MGSKISTSRQPVIMTKTYVEEKFVHDLALVEDLNISELKRLVKMDGIESSLVLTLKFEQQRLLNIANIWKFSLLTKLEIANNFIEEIEGLDTLSRLHHLDKKTDDSVTSGNKNAKYQSTESFSYLWDTNLPDKEAFVDGLASGRGFEILLENDKNFSFLHSYPPASRIAEKYPFFFFF